jgi:hypothetical protein
MSVSSRNSARPRARAGGIGTKNQAGHRGTAHSTAPDALDVARCRRRLHLCLLKTPKDRERLEIFADRCTVAGMITIYDSFPRRFHTRLPASSPRLLGLELIALRHQVSVLRRQRPGRIWLFSTDRLLWVWLYRVWPQVLNAMVLVKPATVVQWHRKGFRTYWPWRSRRPGRPKMSTEIRDLIRQMSLANPLWGAPRNVCRRWSEASTSSL